MFSIWKELLIYNVQHNQKLTVNFKYDYWKKYMSKCMDIMSIFLNAILNLNINFNVHSKNLHYLKSRKIAIKCKVKKFFFIEITVRRLFCSFVFTWIFLLRAVCKFLSFCMDYRNTRQSCFHNVYRDNRDYTGTCTVFLAKAHRILHLNMGWYSTRYTWTRFLCWSVL